MTVRSLATKLAAVPERAIEGLPSLSSIGWKPQRSGSPGAIAAAIGLGLAVGIAIGLLLQVRTSKVAPDDSTPGEIPGQYT